MCIYKYSKKGVKSYMLRIFKYLLPYIVQKCAQKTYVMDVMSKCTVPDRTVSQQCLHL